MRYVPLSSFAWVLSILASVTNCGLLAPAAYAQSPVAAKPQSPVAAKPQAPARPRTNEPLPRRIVELDVLIQAQPNYRLRSQEWGRTFQELGYTPQFRQPKAGESVRVEDVVLDGTPCVRIVCGMSPDGSIRIRDKKFTIADAKVLKEFLDDLARYGAGGPPEKDARWGMTEGQLLELSRLFSEPVGEDVQLEGPLVTVEAIGLPSEVRVKFSEVARTRALGRPPSSAPESLPLKGVSKGTAIALVLAQYGLGFRPQRLTANSYEIEIDTGDESSNLWPVGWKTQESTAETLPAYLKPIPVDVEDAEVSALLEVVSGRLKISVFTSSFALATANRDLDVLTYTRKADRVSPSRLLASIGDKMQLGFDVRVDEAGKLFLWATTDEEVEAFRKRFAHVSQK